MQATLDRLKMGLIGHKLSTFGPPKPAFWRCIGPTVRSNGVRLMSRAFMRVTNRGRTHMSRAQLLLGRF